jgi:predicted esterase
MKALMRSLWKKADADEREMLANVSVYLVCLFVAMAAAIILLAVWLIWKQPPSNALPIASDAPKASDKAWSPTSTMWQPVGLNLREKAMGEQRYWLETECTYYSKQKCEPVILVSQPNLPDVVPVLKQAKTPEGYRYGWLGELPKKPMPTILFIGGEIEYSLTDPLYSISLEVLCEKAFCLTIDGPGEGADVVDPKMRSLNLWAKNLADKKDFMGDFTRRANVVLNKLIADGAIDWRQMGVFGTSRGAFAAFHLASVDPRFKAIVALSPVTDLSVISEFANVQDEAIKFTKESQKLFAERLYKRPIYMSIGPEDKRVGTKEADDFYEAMKKAAYVQNVTPAIELERSGADGHLVSPRAFGDATRRIWSELTCTRPDRTKSTYYCPYGYVYPYAPRSSKNLTPEAKKPRQP